MSTIRISWKHARALLVLGDRALNDTAPERAALAAIRAELARLERKPRSSAAKKTEKKRRDRAVETSDIYAQVEARAQGRCEACLAPFSKADPQHLDHWRGRGKARQTVENTWMLHKTCHRNKTDNRPDALTWLEKFIAHCTRHGYRPERLVDEARADAIRLTEQAAALMRGAR